MNGYFKKRTRMGFTLLEIMIVVSILTLVAIIGLLMLNPQAQLFKFFDAQRKRDLNQMTKIFEEYYSDKESYPISTDICIDTPIEDDGVCSCHVCGLSSQTSQLKSYARRLYCDPSYPTKRYLYQYDCSSSPAWYRICASLDGSSSQIPGVTYNYGVASSNISADQCSSFTGDPLPTLTDTITPSPTIVITNPPQPTNTPPSGSSPTPGPTDTPSLRPTHNPGPLPTCYPDPIAKWCWKSGCNNCGTFAECLTPIPAKCDPPPYLYTVGCSQECTL